MAKKIIALTGYKGSGKDEAVKALKGFTTLKFAEPIKEVCRTLLRCQGVTNERIIEEYIEGMLKQTPSTYFGGKTCREAQQTIGTEWGRDLISETYWTDILVKAVGVHDNVCVTDMRFPNELEAMKKLGAVTIRILRPSLFKDQYADHPSEAYIPDLDADYEIINDGSIEDLQNSLLTICEENGLL